jgi:hypothetical protein
MRKLNAILKAHPAVGVTCVLLVGYLVAGVAAQQMKLTDGTFANKVVVYTLDGTAAGGGDASAANQTTQIGHLAAIESATEGAAASLDNIEANLSSDAVQGNDVIATFPQIGGEAKDFDGSALPNNVTEGKSIRGAFTLYGGLFGFLTNEDGSKEAGALEDAAHGDGDYGFKIWSRRIDAPASSAGASGDYAAINTNASGAVWVSQIDPCSSEAKSRTAISQTADAVIISAAASKKNYICSIVLVAGAAEIVNIVEGTGSTCGTSQAAIIGSTTEANGLSFAANGGFSSSGGNATVIPGSGTNVDTCLMVSGTNRVAGFVTWVQR